MKFHLSNIQGFARFRPTGYVDEIVSRGTISAGFIELSDADFAELHRKYNPVKPRMAGLGDAVAAIAQPIARMIDGRLGTDLENCPGCKADKETLNRLIPFA